MDEHEHGDEWGRRVGNPSERGLSGHGESAEERLLMAGVRAWLGIRHCVEGTAGAGD